MGAFCRLAGSSKHFQFVAVFSERRLRECCKTQEVPCFKSGHAVKAACAGIGLRGTALADAEHWGYMASMDRLAALAGAARVLGVGNGRAANMRVGTIDAGRLRKTMRLKWVVCDCTL